jgi:hypothetical protein
MIVMSALLSSFIVRQTVSGNVRSCPVVHNGSREKTAAELTDGFLTSHCMFRVEFFICRKVSSHRSLGPEAPHPNLDR